MRLLQRLKLSPSQVKFQFLTSSRWLGEFSEVRRHCLAHRLSSVRDPTKGDTEGIAASFFTDVERSVQLYRDTCSVGIVSGRHVSQALSGLILFIVQSLNKIFGSIFNFSPESPIKLLPHFSAGTGRKPAVDTTITRILNSRNLILLEFKHSMPRELEKRTTQDGLAQLMYEVTLVALVEGGNIGCRYLGVLLDETVAHLFEFRVAVKMNLHEEVELLSSPLVIVGYKLADPFVEGIVVECIRFVRSLGPTHTSESEGTQQTSAAST